MLERLVVRGLGVIDEVTVSFGPGLTALTGETGAGKTLIVEALQLVLGGRADPGLVRDGCDRAEIEATFRTGDALTTLRREIPRQGRSKAMINGESVAASDLAATAHDLIDIHGQHDAQSLFSPHAARDLLDHVGHLDPTPLAHLRHERTLLARELAALGGDDGERLRKADLLRFQLNEITAASITAPDEEQSLEAEAAILEQVDVIAAHLATARAVLDADDDTSLISGLQGLVGALDAVAATGDLAMRAREIVALSADLSGDIRARAESLDADPERLDVISERRRVLADLKRKYGPTLDDVVAFAHSCAEELDALEHADVRRAELTSRTLVLDEAITAAAIALGEQRRQVAPQLSASVTATLRTLALAHATFEVVVGEDDAGDDVTCYFSANPGQRPQPLIRVASGGELARTMLALRLASPEGPSAMVFDEVDAGVGGQAARALADALGALATQRQVLVVTHLAQVAAVARDHLVIDKVVTATTTATTVRAVAGEDRVTELARMLSGQPDSEVARAHGRELLEEQRGSGVSPRRASEVV